MEKLNVAHAQRRKFKDPQSRSSARLLTTFSYSHLFHLIHLKSHRIVIVYVGAVVGLGSTFCSHTEYCLFYDCCWISPLSPWTYGSLELIQLHKSYLESQGKCRSQDRLHRAWRFQVQPLTRLQLNIKVIILSGFMTSDPSFDHICTTSVKPINTFTFIISAVHDLQDAACCLLIWAYTLKNWLIWVKSSPLLFTNLSKVLRRWGVGMIQWPTTHYCAWTHHLFKSVEAAAAAAAAHATPSCVDTDSASLSNAPSLHTDLQ